MESYIILYLLTFIPGFFTHAKPTITKVEGDYSFGFVRPSVDTMLFPQLLLQFSRDFDETFKLSFP